MHPVFNPVARIACRLCRLDPLEWILYNLIEDAYPIPEKYGYSFLSAQVDT